MNRELLAIAWLETVLQDLRSALRGIRRGQGFTIITLLVLALGIGGNTAMFSIVDAWLLRSLPYRDPQGLVAIWRSELSRPKDPSIFNFYSDFEEWQRQNHSFEKMAGAFWSNYILTGQGETKGLDGQIVTVNLFSVLGVRAWRGRTFVPEDLHGPAVVVLGHGAWLDRFGADPDIIGKVVTLNDRPYNVIGIMPPGFGVRILDSPNHQGAWTLMGADADELRTNPVRPVAVFARLKPGIDAAAAQAELSVIQRQLDEKNPRAAKGYGVLVAGLQQDLTRTARSTLFALLAAVAFVLLIACANVANLLLGRATERRREMAIRSALGSGRRRLVRELLTESILLSLLGGSLGLLLASVGLRYFAAHSPLKIPPIHPLVIELRIVAFTALLSLLTGCLFGLIPALQASRADINDLLKEGGSGASAGIRSHRARSLLIVGEVALSLVLLVGASLMIETFSRLSAEPIGFRPENVTRMSVPLPKGAYGKLEDHRNFTDRLVEKIGALPGVQAVGAGDDPLYGYGGSDAFIIEGRPTPPLEEAPSAGWVATTAGYFPALGIQILEGRLFDGRDRERSEGVAIVNQDVARRFFPDGNPLGKRIRKGGSQSQSPWLTIIGVVADTKFLYYNSINWRVTKTIYVPHRQAEADSRPWRTTNLPVFIRTAGLPPSAAALRDALWSVDKNLPAPRIESMNEDLSRFLAQPRWRMMLVGAFAALALLLAAIGIYGVLAQGVAQRRHEIGVRMALGAAPGDVLKMIIGRGLVLTLTGIVAGLAGALATTRLIQTFLYGVKPTDPAAFVAVSLLMLAVAFFASFLPARTATRIDPMDAIRHD